MSTGHTHRDPSSMIMNAELSDVKVSVPSTVTIGMKNVQKQKTKKQKNKNKTWLNESL
jgi:hypothetical protein